MWKIAIAAVMLLACSTKRPAPPDVGKVCTYDPWCCQAKWDEICAAELKGERS